VDVIPRSFHQEDLWCETTSIPRLPASVACLAISQLASLVAKVLDLRLDSCESDSRPPTLILIGWPSLGGQTTSVFHRTMQANSASYPQRGRI